MANRTTNQIQIAVQENEPDVTEEELRLCIEAQRSIKHFYKAILVDLIEAIREGKPAAYLKIKAEFAWGTIERMFDAEKKPPAEWLGPNNIPGSPAQKAQLEWAKKVFEKATGNGAIGQMDRGTATGMMPNARLAHFTKERTMGLDTTHDAFHGAYSSFNRFRKAVAKACGGSYPPHEDESLDPRMWYFDGSSETHPGLTLFFNHSDCDGEFSPQECELVANELEPLIPKLEEMGPGSGHIEGRGGYAEVLRKFIAGCREAAAAGETLEFR